MFVAFAIIDLAMAGLASVLVLLDGAPQSSLQQLTLSGIKPSCGCCIRPASPVVNARQHFLPVDSVLCTLFVNLSRQVGFFRRPMRGHRGYAANQTG